MPGGFAQLREGLREGSVRHGAWSNGLRAPTSEEILMSKILNKGLAVVISGIAAIAAWTGPSAAEDTCSSEASCARYVVCPSGDEKVGTTSVYCKDTIAATTATPTCNMRNLRSDWTFSSSRKECC